MSTLPNLLGWFFPRRQAKAQGTSRLLPKPQPIFANYQHGRAIVANLILPGQRGRVWFKASWWPARCPLEIVLCQGQPVRVVGIDRITLIVEPITETPSPSPANPLDMPSAAPTSAAPTLSLTALTASALDPTLGLGAQPVNALVSPSVCPREYVS